MLTTKFILGIIGLILGMAIAHYGFEFGYSLRFENNNLFGNFISSLFVFVGDFIAVASIIFGIFGGLTWFL
jgi:hypothetical protein